MTRGRRAAPGSAVCMKEGTRRAAARQGAVRPRRAGIPAAAAQKVHTMETPATESIADQSKEVARIAAFSDGVFAIAITLLTLQLEIPRSGDLAQDLIDLQPNFLAFVISFLVIGYVLGGAPPALRGRGALRLPSHLAEPAHALLHRAPAVHHVGDRRVRRPAAGGDRLRLVAGRRGLRQHRSGRLRPCRASPLPASTSWAVAGFNLWRGAAVAIYFMASLLLLLLPTGTEIVMYSWFGIPVARAASCGGTSVRGDRFATAGRIAQLMPEMIERFTLLRWVKTARQAVRMDAFSDLRRSVQVKL